MKLLDHLLSIFYPHTCAACLRPLLAGEDFLCLDCHLELPKTNFHRQENNALMQKFTGRCKLEQATGYFYFQKGGRVQRLLHRLKYQNQPEVGLWLGEMIATELIQSEFLSPIDMVVPVPLHPRKLALRGYNQSAKLAEGLTRVSPLILSLENLVRAEFSDTQTRKGRYDRWLNVATKFVVQRPQEFRFRHVLLVDDVVTTGATIEACYAALAAVEGVQVSLLCAAVAEY